MKKIFTNLLMLAFSATVVFAQQTNSIDNQSKFFDKTLNSEASPLNFDQNKIKTGATTTNGSMKTSALTYYTINYREVATAQGFVPANQTCLIFPDTTAIWERNDTSFGEYGKNAFGSANAYNWSTGSFGFSDVFTPGTQLISNQYTPSTSSVQFSTTNATVVDSVAFFYVYSRAKAFAATVDTLIVYFVNNSAIQTIATGGNWPYSGAADFNLVRIGNYSPAANAPSTFFKSDTILLTVTDSSNPGTFSLMSLSVDSHIIAPGESMGIAWKYLPGRTITPNDTIVDRNDFTAKSDQSIFGVGAWFEDGTAGSPTPLAAGGLESPVGNMCGWLRPNDFAGFNFPGYQWSHGWTFNNGALTPIFEHGYTLWEAAPVGVAVTASNNAASADCRTVTFTATDNFNADSWSWDFGDGTGTQVTAVNTVMHTYTSPSAPIAVTCTATETVSATTFVAQVNTPILNFCTGIEESVLGASVGFYPNPATKSLNININSTDAQDLNVAIIDILGVSVYSNALNNVISYSNIIDISQLASGVYFIKVSNDNNAIVKKLIVE